MPKPLQEPAAPAPSRIDDSSAEINPSGPLTELAAVLVGHGQFGGSGDDVCLPGLLVEEPWQDPEPQFTELRALDQDSSFSSLGLSTSVCSLSLLESGGGPSRRRRVGLRPHSP